MCNLKALQEIHKLDQEEKILAYLTNEKIGLKVEKDRIEEIDPSHFDEIDPNTTFWYYDGPLDDKTRSFCQAMLIQGKFYTNEEMDYLSAKLSYDVFLYCGSYNCRHTWKRARIKGKIKDGTLDESLIADNADARKVAKTQDI